MTEPSQVRFRVGVVGARGHVGGELLKLVVGHPALDLVYSSSRQLAGQTLASQVSEAANTTIEFEDLGAIEVAKRDADVVFLALPNGLSDPYVDALRSSHPDVCLVDLSADHRFDDGWVYGLPEHNREAISGARAIANPGCYATAAQVALEPLAGVLARPPSIFGVSGYSGAGTTPSPKNDVELLRDNLMPYALIGHVHEREIGHHLGRTVRFMPHVASYFRGITLTIDCELEVPLTVHELEARFRRRYADEPLVHVTKDAPLVRDSVGRHGVQVGGFAASDRRVVLVATIDNLLKGAATQAIQNVNLALGLPELTGIA